ncbi:MAG TPA: Clp protease N-terminal domain-containing protein [Solirubrobacter sp.]|nr:Clp protease N-terminal domain-containing protein [Solirubrobacter sp.]
MAPNAQRIVALLESALTDPVPTRALTTLTELRRELDELERVHVARGLQAGDSYADVARPLGISRQAAHRRYRGLATNAPAAPPPKPTLTPEARTALIRAREEAAKLGSGSVDSTHLLLAIAAQRGLDVEAARRSFGPPALNARTPSGLHPSLHARLTRDAGPLRLDHLVRAALEDVDARRLLERLGIGPGRLLMSRP